MRFARERGHSGSVRPSEPLLRQPDVRDGSTQAERSSGARWDALAPLITPDPNVRRTVSSARSDVRDRSTQAERSEEGACLRPVRRAVAVDGFLDRAAAGRRRAIVLIGVDRGPGVRIQAGTTLVWRVGRPDRPRVARCAFRAVVPLDRNYPRIDAGRVVFRQGQRGTSTDVDRATRPRVSARGILAATPK
jgi:hypothetical protein